MNPFLIQAMSKALSDVKGPRCPQCGKPLPPVKAKQPNPKPVRCPECGTLLSPPGPRKRA